MRRVRHPVRADVLALPTMAQMQAALPAGMRAAAIAMLLAGDPGSNAARRRVIDAVRGAGVPDYDDAAVDADLESGPDPAAGRSIAERLDALAGQLAVPRQGVVPGRDRQDRAGRRCADRVRAADAPGRSPRWLGMTPAQAVGVIALTEEGASAE